MDRVSVTRISVAVLGGLAAVSALTVLAAFADDSGAGALWRLGVFEWVAPILAGASVGVVAWLVLGTAPAESRDPTTHNEEACPACGRLILDDWRLCPHCGTLVEHHAAADDRDLHTGR